MLIKLSEKRKRNEEENLHFIKTNSKKETSESYKIPFENLLRLT